MYSIPLSLSLALVWGQTGFHGCSLVLSAASITSNQAADLLSQYDEYSSLGLRSVFPTYCCCCSVSNSETTIFFVQLSKEFGRNTTHTEVYIRWIRLECLGARAYRSLTYLVYTCMMCSGHEIVHSRLWPQTAAAATAIPTKSSLPNTPNNTHPSNSHCTHKKQNDAVIFPKCGQARSTTKLELCANLACTRARAAASASTTEQQPCMCPGVTSDSMQHLQNSPGRSSRNPPQ